MTFEEVIDALSKEKLTAEFTPNFYTTRRNSAPYGYYEIKKSPHGSVMIKVDYVDSEEDNPADMIRIQGQNLDLYAFDEKISPLKRFFGRGKETHFNRGIRFINSLETVSSRLTEDEAFLRWCHFTDSEEDKQALNKHYLNARVMYDTMDEMIGAKKCTFYKKNGGYVIRALFGDGSMERIDIKPTKKCYEGSNVPYPVMNIIIPSVDVRDKFDDCTNNAEMMVFRKAQEFINMANNPQGGHAISKSETFTRWDEAYIDMMAKIKSRRTKVR
ncbi:MAG: hypothetical protein J6Y07_04725 [Alphaproteobacteria bacterium]|nr:hypothetical protein [Alphaproteobacteria bacterium]